MTEQNPNLILGVPADPDAPQAASSGDAEAVEYIVQGWHDRKPEEMRGRSETARMALASLLVGVSRGDTADAVANMHRLLLEMGCSEACHPFFQATFHDRLGEHGTAAELYERVLEPGYDGWGLNTGERLHAMIRLGPLYEEIGDTAKAIDAYRRMADQWAVGDARGLEKVGRFRARIAALTAWNSSGGAQP